MGVGEEREDYNLPPTGILSSRISFKIIFLWVSQRVAISLRWNLRIRE